MILNSVLKEPNVRATDKPDLSFEEKRKQTLDNLKLTSDLLKESKPGEMNDYKLIFINGDQEVIAEFFERVPLVRDN